MYLHRNVSTAAKCHLPLKVAYFMCVRRGQHSVNLDKVRKCLRKICHLRWMKNILLLLVLIHAINTLI